MNGGLTADTPCVRACWRASKRDGPWRPRQLLGEEQVKRFLWSFFSWGGRVPPASIFFDLEACTFFCFHIQSSKSVLSASEDISLDAGVFFLRK